MKIILSPQASNKTTQVSLNGLVLTIDGVDIDLSVIPEGGEAEGEYPLIGKVTRDEVTVAYQYDSSLAEPYQSTDWTDYTFEVVDGVVPCPIIWKQVQPIEEVVND